LTLSDTNAEAAETWVDAMGIFRPLKRAGVCHMKQDRSTPITETAEEPTGCGPDSYY
jgi:hypothetical protein